MTDFQKVLRDAFSLSYDERLRLAGALLAKESRNSAAGDTPQQLFNRLLEEQIAAVEGQNAKLRDDLALAEEEIEGFEHEIEHGHRSTWPQPAPVLPSSSRDYRVHYRVKCEELEALRREKVQLEIDHRELRLKLLRLHGGLHTPR